MVKRDLIQTTDHRTLCKSGLRGKITGYYLVVALTARLGLVRTNIAKHLGPKNRHKFWCHAILVADEGRGPGILNISNETCILGLISVSHVKNKYEIFLHQCQVLFFFPLQRKAIDHHKIIFLIDEIVRTSY